MDLSSLDSPLYVVKKGDTNKEKLTKNQLPYSQQTSFTSVCVILLVSCKCFSKCLSAETFPEQTLAYVNYKYLI